MLTMEEMVKAKVLEEQGYSIRQIARKLGKSRNTVRKALRQEGAVEYKRAEVSSKLEPYKGYIQAKIEQESMYTASRLFREIKGLGYAGSSRLVRLYVEEIRVKREKSATIRFETLPGQQGQVDFDFYKRVKFSDYEEERKVSRFSMVLGYCRMVYYGYYFRHDLESFLYGHISAF
ncbi:MAG: helix-turn-helix domain-containing protein [Nitrospirota bacterium]